MVSQVLELLGKASIDMWSNPEGAGTFDPRRAQAIAEQICTPQIAFEILKHHFKDEDYVRAWHDNLSMAFQDAGCERSIAQDGASRFMSILFGVNYVPNPPPVPSGPTG